MHASSYIRYLEMSKSCKIDTNSYSEAGSLCPSDASEEVNLAPNVHRALLIAFPLTKNVWCTETQGLRSSHRLRLQTVVRHCGVLIPWQKVVGSLWTRKVKGTQTSSGAAGKEAARRLTDRAAPGHNPGAGGSFLSKAEKQSENTGCLTAIPLPPPHIKPSHHAFEEQQMVLI